MYMYICTYACMCVYIYIYIYIYISNSRVHIHIYMLFSLVSQNVSFDTPMALFNNTSVMVSAEITKLHVNLSFSPTEPPPTYH